MSANRAFTAANLLLLTAAAYFGVSIFYAVLVGRLDAGLPAAAPVRAEAAPNADAPGGMADYRVVVERNLFNSGRQALAGPAGPALELDKLKQTELKLKLWGTVTGRDGQTYAVIEDQKTREQSLYRPGDAIQNAAVKLVLRHKVVLTVGGRDEVLAMEEPGVTRAPGPARAEAPARGPAAEAVQPVVVPAEQIDKAMENIGDLLNQATFRPHIEDGKAAGISITGIKPNAIFRRLRLRNGDIITGVNGMPIASVDDAVQAMSSLSPDGPVQVKVKRRGQEETLEYKTE
ncbi:MAG TPA: type II secretion system protein GspC [Desulfobacterales bacterium]|nr:type II secretion system protein GspC [Desulfobacterales bacterium]